MAKTPVERLLEGHKRQGIGYWLMKSEPDVYSLDNLKADKKAPWDGVRNYQARNFMRDHMKIGDQVLFYHSNAKPPGVAGLATVSKEAFPDPEAFNEKSKYFDPKSDPDNPRWVCVEVQYKSKFRHFVSLEEIRQHPVLQEMLVAKRGQRLSIQPCSKKQFETVVELGRG